MEGLVLIFLIVIALYSANSKAKEKELNRENLRSQNIKNENLKDVVKCPKCLSTQVSANKQGITLTTGLIGTQNVWITCLQCGHKWKAGN
jgi:hypothetical protein